MRVLLLMLTVVCALVPELAAQPRPDAPPASKLYMQADELIHESGGKRVIARGNVEIYYDNSILTADEVIYDEKANKLIAQGSARLKDPDGAVTRADRIEVGDELRKAFADQLSGGKLTPP